MSTGRIITALIAAAALGGCKNACQQVCVRMADYAEECGYSVPQEQIQACIDEQASAEGEDAQACRDYGTPDALRREWSCDELDPYWNGGGGEQEGETAR